MVTRFCIALDSGSFLLVIVLFLGLIISVRRKEKRYSKLSEENFETIFRVKELFHENARKETSRIITQ